MKKHKTGPVKITGEEDYFDPKLGVQDWITKPYLIEQVEQGIREMERDPDYYGLNEL